MGCSTTYFQESKNVDDEHIKLLSALLSNYESKYQENDELLVLNINQPLTDFDKLNIVGLNIIGRTYVMLCPPHVQGFNLNFNFLNKIWKLKWEKEQFGPFLLNHA